MHWLVGGVTHVLISSAVIKAKWEHGSAFCSVLARTIKSGCLTWPSGKANGMSEASLKISLHLCEAGESAVPNGRLLAMMFSVTMPVYQNNCVISTSPKCKPQICQNSKRMHWKHCLFVCIQSNGTGYVKHRFVKQGCVCVKQHAQEKWRTRI